MITLSSRALAIRADTWPGAVPIASASSERREPGLALIAASSCSPGVGRVVPGSCDVLFRRPVARLARGRARTIRLHEARRGALKYLHLGLDLAQAIGHQLPGCVDSRCHCLSSFANRKRATLPAGLRAGSIFGQLSREGLGHGRNVGLENSSAGAAKSDT